MFCMNCGKQLESGGKFCPYCGAKLNEAVEAEQPEAVVEPVMPEQQPEPEMQIPEETVTDESVEEATAEAAPGLSQPAEEAPSVQEPIITGKKKKNGALIGIGVAAVAVLVAAILLFTGVFASAQVKLGKAVLKSVQSYEDVYNDLGGMDVAALLEGEKFSQKLELTIGELDDDATLDGVGVRVSSDVDIPGQKMDFVLTPFYESADVATVQAGFSGSKLYVGSPELTAGQLYGVDTVTLGQDLAGLTGDDSMEGLSFNVFDLIKQIKNLQDNKTVKDGIAAANKALLESLEVTKQEKKDIKVNGNNIKATQYQVVLTTEALDDYLDALEETIDAGQLGDNLEALLEAMGLPEDVRDEVMAEYEYYDPADSFDVLHDVVDEMDDVEVDAYVGNGYLVSVEYEGDFDGDRFTLKAQLGGGKNYVDDITVSFKVKGEGEVVLESTGNHCGAGGVFTDETTVTLKEDGSKEVVFASECEYNKKDLSIKGEMAVGYDIEISYKGTWEMDKNAMDLQLSKLKVVSWDSVVFEGAVGYALGAYESAGVNTSNVTMLLQMTEEELMELGESLYDNAMTLVEDLDLDMPGLLSRYTQEAPMAYDSDAYWAGYDMGYEDGYEDGWDETDYDVSGGFEYDGDVYTGYLDGYDDGYGDGYEGYSYGYNYGDGV